MSKIKDKLPVLAGDFCMVSVSERLMWRDALAHRVLDGLDMPSWKKEEQKEPLNATVACLLRKGVTDPAAIMKHFSNMGLRGYQNASN